MEKLKVGQQLWFVPNSERVFNSKPRFVVVEKVGKKWATMSGCERISLDTLQVDGKGYSSPGRCFISQEAHEMNTKRKKAFEHVSHTLYCHGPAPDGISISDIIQAGRLLGIDMSEFEEKPEEKEGA